VRPADTSPEAHAVQLAIYRRLGPDGRLALALRVSDDVRSITRSGLRTRHPEHSEDEIDQALRRLLLGDELFERAPRAPSSGGVSGSEATDFLERSTARLREARVPYMVVGSFASAVHGVPRSGRDLDLVIDPDEPSLVRFVKALPPDEYHADLESALDALQRRGRFDVVDGASAWKADLIVRKARPFSIEELRRRHVAQVEGVQVFVASPEDTLLGTLEQAARGAGSELQRRDAAGIVEVQGSALDADYIDRWAAELGVSDLWAKLRPVG
jgi:hypothetical protein